jgi:hypothetical protein
MRGPYVLKIRMTLALRSEADTHRERGYAPDLRAEHPVVVKHQGLAGTLALIVAGTRTNWVHVAAVEKH